MYMSICVRLLANASLIRSLLSRVLPALIVLGVCVSINGLVTENARADSDAEPVIKKYSAVARKSMDFKEGNVVQKVDFRFDGATAWLRQNGDFGVDAEIKHQWLLCGTYEVGIRFGIGSPACTNVSWVTDPRYVSRRKQCNNAWMVHTGNGNDAEIPGDFPQITCAQLLIKCTGKCK